MAGAGKRQGGGAVAYVNRCNALAFVDGVDGYVLRFEVAHVEHGIVAGDQAAHGIVAHQVGAAHVIGGSDDFGDGIAEGVGDKQFAPVGLEGQMYRSEANIHHGFQAIWFVRIDF